MMRSKYQHKNPLWLKVKSDDSRKRKAENEQPITE